VTLIAEIGFDRFELHFLSFLRVAALMSAVAPPSTLQQHDATTVATNVRRLMARAGLTFHNIVESTGLDERTLRGLVRGTNNPHARTLHKLAHGLGVPVDELFQTHRSSPQRAFDEATNPAVENAVQAHAEIFRGWSEAELSELTSQFGMGGPLSETGVLAAAEVINAKRALLRQVSVILESGESELLTEFVKLLYQRIRVSSVGDSQ
jgi:transcriptional regulator with XRE-family HTH domain